LVFGGSGGGDGGGGGGGGGLWCVEGNGALIYGAHRAAATPRTTAISKNRLLVARSFRYVFGCSSKGWLKIAPTPPKAHSLWNGKLKSTTTTTTWAFNESFHKCDDLRLQHEGGAGAGRKMIGWNPANFIVGCWSVGWWRGEGENGLAGNP